MTIFTPSLTFTVIGDSAAFGTGDLDEHGNPRWTFYEGPFISSDGYSWAPSANWLWLWLWLST